MIPFFITSLSPDHGPVGTQVVITGAGFTGTTEVTFNGVDAAFTVNSDTKITATVPVGATTDTVHVWTGSTAVAHVPAGVHGDFVDASGAASLRLNPERSRR